MDKTKLAFDGLVAITGTVVGYVFGGWDVSLTVLLILMGADYISGVLVGISDKNLSSAIGFKGIAKKIVLLIIVGLGALIDRLLGNQGWVCRNLTAWFYIANEGISILENASSLGLPVPSKISAILSQIKDRTEAE